MDQNATTDAPGWQLSRRDQVLDRAKRNGKSMSHFPLTEKNSKNAVWLVTRILLLRPEGRLGWSAHGEFSPLSTSSDHGCDRVEVNPRQGES